MRLKLLALLLIGSVLLAGCALGSESNGEQDGPPATTGSQPALSTVAPESGDSYPVPATPATGGYPASPQEAGPPTAYPELTAIPPAMIALTPIAPSGGQPVTPSSHQERLIEATARDLNSRTDVPVDEIEVVSAVAVLWPNAGLGCPADGMNYAEVIVEGMLVTLNAGNNDYTYHTDMDGNYVLCQNGRPAGSGSISQD